jgi:hypothetical protein
MFPQRGTSTKTEKRSSSAACFAGQLICLNIQWTYLTDNVGLAAQANPYISLPIKVPHSFHSSPNTWTIDKMTSVKKCLQIEEKWQTRETTKFTEIWMETLSNPETNNPVHEIQVLQTSTLCSSSKPKEKPNRRQTIFVCNHRYHVLKVSRLSEDTT